MSKNILFSDYMLKVYFPQGNVPSSFMFLKIISMIIIPEQICLLSDEHRCLILAYEKAGNVSVWWTLVFYFGTEVCFSSE